MPLQRSSSPEAFKQNVRTLMGEVGKSPHVQSRKQALAIAYATQRRAGKHQAGGEVGGLVDHPHDPDLPPVQDHAELTPLMPGHDPAYLAVIQRLLEGQKRLNAMHPIVREQLRRYWLGGLIRRMYGGPV